MDGPGDGGEAVGGGSEAPESGIYGLGCRQADAEVVLVPVPWEATVSKGWGTAGAPQAIVAASRQVDLFDVELGEIARTPIAMVSPDPEIETAGAEAVALARPLIKAFDAGRAPAHDDPRLVRVNALCTVMRERVEQTVGAWLERGRLVGVVGGDHSVALGAIAAHAGHFGPLGVLQIDAHADLRPAYQGFSGSHASVMHRVLDELGAVRKLVSVGVRDLCHQEHQTICAGAGRVTAFFDSDLAAAVLAGRPFEALAAQIADELPERVYLSLDIDGLDPGLCPHTGTPVPGGLSFAQLGAVLRAAVASGRQIVGFDLCEVAPGPEQDDDWDANVAARVLYRVIGYALASRPGAGAP